VTDLRSWAKRWNDASLRQIATSRRPVASGRWPLLGFFTAGLVAGAIGSYAISQRSQIKRLVGRAVMARRELLSEFRRVEGAPPVPVKSNISNHRRKAAAEVT
jgi:hypothetical protein